MNKKFKKGGEIFKQGAVADCAYFILSGEVAISHQTTDGNAPIFARLGKGEIFGEYALARIPGDAGEIPRRLATAVASEACELQIVTPIEFNDRLRKLDPFMRQWIQLLIDRSIKVSRQLNADTPMS